MEEYRSIMSRKLGLSKYNKELISKLLTNLAVDKVDYTNFFRLLSNVKAATDTDEKSLLDPLRAALLDIGQERRDAWVAWVKSYVQEASGLQFVLLGSFIMGGFSAIDLQSFINADSRGGSYGRGEESGHGHGEPQVRAPELPLPERHRRRRSGRLRRGEEAPDLDAAPL